MSLSKNSVSDGPLEIGILEIRRHVSDLNTFSKIFKTKNTNVTIFTTKKLFLRLKMLLDDPEKYDIVLKNDNENVFSFLKRVENICNKKMDLLFVNTIHEIIFDLICYLNFKPKCKMVLEVHHANAWLRPKLVFCIKHILRTIDTNLSSALISKFILPKFDAINVPYGPMKHYIKTETNYDKEIFAIPTRLYETEGKEEIINKQDEVKLRIVMPGIIQEHRKNYQVVIPALENLFKSFNGSLAVDVPGWPIGRYGRNVYKAFKKMKNNGYEVFVFDGFVPDDLFEVVLEKSDIILAPIRINSRADGEIKEQYGLTVSSGSVYDAIRFAKPLIVPSEFNMIKELKSSSLTYEDSSGLEEIIAELILHPEKLKKLKKEALVNSKKFSLINLQNYFEKNMVDWLKKN